MTRFSIQLLVATILLAAACGPGNPSPSSTAQQRGGAQVGQAGTGRQLVLAIGRPPDSLAAKPLREVRGSGTPYATMRAFNAGLVLHDNRNLPRAYLAEAIPQLRTDDWRILPDGRTETTYRLRPNLTWHDGAPLIADDFVFAWRVYATPDLGLAASPPINQLDEVVAVDPRTVRFRWTQPYASADDLQAGDFAPLPRHLLSDPFTQRESDAFVTHSFWLNDYVGLGPYRLRRVEVGTFVEGEAFDGHVTGRPRIDSIRLLPITDANTAMANLLADTVHAATDNTIDLPQAVVLDREWADRAGQRGTVIRSQVGVRYANFQLRPEFASPRAVQDIRVRRALAHSVDREALVEGTMDGLTTVADTIVLKDVEYYPALVSDSPLASASRWPALLRDEGFVQVRALVPADPSTAAVSAQQVYVAFSDGELRTVSSKEPARQAPSSDGLPPALTGKLRPFDLLAAPRAQHLATFKDHHDNIWVFLNNPPANMFTNEFLGELCSTLQSVATLMPAGRRIVYLSHFGEYFSLGGDRSELVRTLHDAEAVTAFAEKARALIRVITSLDTMVVAVVNGTAQGGGLETLFATDLQLVRAGVKLGLPEIKSGLIPGMGGLTYLQHLVGPARTKRLVMLGDLVEAEEAHALGIISHVVDDPFAAALALGDGMRNLESAAYMKRMLRRETADRLTADIDDWVAYLTRHAEWIDTRRISNSRLVVTARAATLAS